MSRSGFVSRVTSLLRSVLIQSLTCVLIAVLMGCDGKSNSGSPASWSTQLFIAQQAASKIDKDSVLKEVTVDIGEQPNPEGKYKHLEISFSFINPGSTKTIINETYFPVTRVTFQDTSPTSTLEIKPDWTYLAPLPTQNQLELYKEALTYVRVSPSMALDKTLEEGKLYAQRQRVDPYPIMKLALAEQVPKQFNKPAVWVLDYFTPHGSLFIYIDAQDGEILGQEERKY